MNYTIVNQIEISIIMPVHNTGIYLKEALDSIFSQSFKNFEIICIDDASEDDLTKHILQTYHNQHSNMQLIRLDDNAGAGKARNIGFLKVEGEYTIFLDADDYFAEDLLEKMYESISKHKADVCICGHRDFYKVNEVTCFGREWKPDRQKVSLRNREDWFLNISTVAWDKLCRTDFLKNNNIYFQSLKTCNDVLFSCSVMMCAKEICCIEESPLIFYRVNTANQISANRNPLDLYTALMMLYDTHKNKTDNILLERWIGSLLLRNGIWESRNCKDEKLKYQYYKLAETFLSLHKVNFCNGLLEACARKVEACSDDCRWFWNEMDYLNQLRLAKERLIDRIYGEKELFLWGLGVRGNAFQQFCQESNIKIQGVADIRNNNIGNETEYGNKIMSTDFVLQTNGLVVASTGAIYDYLLDKNVRTLNLEQFCFI